MQRMKIGRTVQAPADVLWEVVTDLGRAPEIVRGIDGTEIVAGGGSFGVGTRWRETRTMFGRSVTEEMEVTACDEGRSYTAGSESGGVTYAFTFSVVPMGSAASRLLLTFGGQPEGRVARILAATVGRLAQRSTRKAMEADLADLATEAERRAGRT